MLYAPRDITYYTTYYYMYITCCLQHPGDWQSVRPKTRVSLEVYKYFHKRQGGGDRKLRHQV